MDIVRIIESEGEEERKKEYKKEHKKEPRIWETMNLFTNLVYTCFA